jgi:hypothetical protein
MPLKTNSPNGKWLVTAGPENTAVVKKIDTTYGIFPPAIRRLLVYLHLIKTHEHGIFYGHQMGLYKKMFGFLIEGTWDGDDELTTMSTDESRIKWNVPKCALIKVYTGNK